MATINPSQVIIVVKPIDPRSQDVLIYPHNKARLNTVSHNEPRTTLSLWSTILSRESTPFVPATKEVELYLMLQPFPKDASRGFVFGKDARYCDVVLDDPINIDPQKICGISRQHFALRFNWNSGLILVANLSQHSTGVKAPSILGNYKLLKHSDTTMLHPAEQTRVCAGATQFDLCFPARNKVQSI